MLLAHTFTLLSLLMVVYYAFQSHWTLHSAKLLRIESWYLETTNPFSRLNWLRSPCLLCCLFVSVCRSRAKNIVLVGLLGGKEMLQGSQRGFENRVRLEVRLALVCLYVCLSARMCCRYVRTHTCLCLSPCVYICEYVCVVHVHMYECVWDSLQPVCT